MTIIGMIANNAVRFLSLRGNVAKLGVGVLLGAALLALPVTSAKAVPITSDLTITGTVDIDEVDSTLDGSASQTGTMDLTSGGTDSQSTISGTMVSGSDPLSGSLTDTGDGVGASGSLSGSSDGDGSFFVIDLTMEIMNTSLTDTFEITFKITYDNSVDADGIDAFAQSEFSVDDPLNVRSSSRT